MHTNCRKKNSLDGEKSKKKRKEITNDSKKSSKNLDKISGKEKTMHIAHTIIAMFSCGCFFDGFVAGVADAAAVGAVLFHIFFSSLHTMHSFLFRLS